MISNYLLLFPGHTPISPSDYCTREGYVMGLGHGQVVSNVMFQGFDRPKCRALGVARVTCICGDDCGGYYVG